MHHQYSAKPTSVSLICYQMCLLVIFRHYSFWTTQGLFSLQCADKKKKKIKKCNLQMFAEVKRDLILFHLTPCSPRINHFWSRLNSHLIRISDRTLNVV